MPSVNNNRSEAERSTPPNNTKSPQMNRKSNRHNNNPVKSRPGTQMEDIAETMEFVTPIPGNQHNQHSSTGRARGGVPLRTSTVNDTRPVTQPGGKRDPMVEAEEEHVPTLEERRQEVF